MSRLLRSLPETPLSIYVKASVTAPNREYSGPIGFHMGGLLCCYGRLPTCRRQLTSTALGSHLCGARHHRRMPVPHRRCPATMLSSRLLLARAPCAAGEGDGPDARCNYPVQRNATGKPVEKE